MYKGILSGCNVDQVLEQTPDICKSASVLGVDPVRLPINLNFHQAHDARAALPELRQACKRWLHDVGIVWPPSVLAVAGLPRLSADYSYKAPQRLQNALIFLPYRIATTLLLHARTRISTCVGHSWDYFGLQMAPRA